MTQVTNKLTIEQAIKRLPDNPELVYIDYRDSFDNDKESLTNIIKTGLPREDEPDRLRDSQWDGVRYIIEDEFTKEELEDLGDEGREAIEQYLLDNDSSNPIKDLMRNTRNPLVLYDTGFYFEDCYGDEIIYQCKEACEYLGIAKKYWKQLYKIRIDASYGGSLMFLIDADLEDFHTHYKKTADRTYSLTNKGYISFRSNIHVCILHTGNGSGWHDDIKLQDKSDIIVPFNPDNLYLDSAFTYGLQEVFGGRIEGDGVTLHTSLPKGKLLNVAEDKTYLAQQQETEKKYIATYKAGGCTFGDNNMSRHRNTPYENNPPACGWRCKDCGHFWYD